MGLYLYGSLVTGDFDNSSDIDLLAVLASELSSEEFTALERMHHHLVSIYPEWNNRLEIAYLSQNALATFRTHTSPIAVISPGEPFHFKTAGNDWLPNWYVVREKGVALFGPAPTTLIAPIAPEDFIDAITDHVGAWGAWLGDTPGRPFQSYAILTLCRAWYTVTYGEQVSKQTAALWAASKLPHWLPLIHNALHWRQVSHEPADPTVTLPDTRQFVAFMQEKILGE